MGGTFVDPGTGILFDIISIDDGRSTQEGVADVIAMALEEGTFELHSSNGATERRPFVAGDLFRFPGSLEIDGKQAAGGCGEAFFMGFLPRMRRGRRKVSELSVIPTVWVRNQVATRTTKQVLDGLFR